MFPIAGLFTKEAIIRRLTSMPVLKTPVMDTVFTNRPQHPLPLIAAHDILPVTQALPLVKRGAPSISATSDTGGIGWYEPLPVRPNVMVSAQELNNLKLLDNGGREAWASAKTDLLRRACRQTTEAICAVALGGVFSWPVKLEGGGFEAYQIAWGVPIPVALPLLAWNNANAALRDVFETLTAMQEALQTSGYGGTVEIWAGSTAYQALFALAEASVTTAQLMVQISDQGINVGGFLVKRRAETYRNPQTGAAVPVLPATTCRMIAMDAGHMMPYAAVDDLDANLQALPFFIKPIKMDDPSGYKLVAESKPFPVPNMRGIADCTVC